jgi:hypothetical protein
MFECEFQIYGLCVSHCLKKARECSNRLEQLEEQQKVEKWKQRYRKNSEKTYVFLNCPFKLIYQ